MKFESFAEFLLTYSWGILIVGMIISTMAFLGYFDLKNIIPPRCEAVPPFSCIGLDIKNSSTIEVMLKSGSNESISIKGVDISRASPPCGGLINASVDGQILPHAIKPRDVIRLKVRCKNQWISNDIFNAEIIIVNIINYTSFNTTIGVNGVVE